MKVQPPHPFLAVEAKVYPTYHPERAKELDVPPQTVKMAAIIRGVAHEVERKLCGK